MPEPDFASVIRASGLVSEGDRGVVMVSGGADSVALLLGLAEVAGPENLAVLHVNYGLRPESGADQTLVERLCRTLVVECEVHRAGSPEGNTQAWAREIRHREAERIREERGMDWIAIGHNRSDQAETFLYRLASSPGVRPLLTMGPRSGPLIRPLLGMDREEVRTLLAGRAEWNEDSTNEDPAYARNRIRLEVIPGLEAVNPAVLSNIGRTREELEEDDDALDEIARNLLLEEWEGPQAGVPSRIFPGQHQAIVRRMLRVLAEVALDRKVAINPVMTRQFLELCRNPEMRSLDLGGGAMLRVESGRVVVLVDGAGEIRPVRLTEGEVPFGDWTIDSKMVGLRQAQAEFADRWLGFFNLAGPDFGVTVRTRQEGDRIEPLGIEGSKSLQDVFVDAGIPASRRATWPVVELNDSILWVPGLTRSRQLLVESSDSPVLRLQATPPFPI